MKNIITLSLLGLLLSCGSNKHPMFEEKTAEEIQQDETYGENQVSAALREALKKGVHKEVTKIANHNGFFKNEEIKIKLPKELSSFDQTFRKTGMGKLSDQGVELLNYTAEKVAKDAKAVFFKSIDATKFSNASGILTDSIPDVATRYYKEKSREDLIKSISPLVQKSFVEVGGEKHWNKIIEQYNALEFIKEKINPNFSDYIAENVVDAAFLAIAREEIEIRTNEEARDTPTLRRIFALQDKKK